MSAVPNNVPSRRRSLAALLGPGERHSPPAASVRRELLHGHPEAQRAMDQLRQWHPYQARTLERAIESLEKQVQLLSHLNSFTTRRRPAGNQE